MALKHHRKKTNKQTLTSESNVDKQYCFLICFFGPGGLVWVPSRSQFSNRLNKSAHLVFCLKPLAKKAEQNILPLCQHYFPMSSNVGLSTLKHSRSSCNCKRALRKPDVIFRHLQRYQTTVGIPSSAVSIQSQCWQTVITVGDSARGSFSSFCFSSWILVELLCNQLYL